MLIPIGSRAQQKEIPELEAHFSALIVKNMDSSLVWYSKVLGFKKINQRDFPDSGLKQANLSRGNALIELIELRTALSPEQLDANYTPKTRLVGFFKIGFLVAEFDKFLDHLEQNNVVFHGKVVLDQASGKRMLIVKDPDGNRIQIFEK